LPVVLVNEVGTKSSAFAKDDDGPWKASRMFNILFDINVEVFWSLSAGSGKVCFEFVAAASQLSGRCGVW